VSLQVCVVCVAYEGYVEYVASKEKTSLHSNKNDQDTVRQTYWQTTPVQSVQLTSAILLSYYINKMLEE
jgi:hypothetical protein